MATWYYGTRFQAARALSFANCVVGRNESHAAAVWRDPNAESELVDLIASNNLPRNVDIITSADHLGRLAKMGVGRCWCRLHTRDGMTEEICSSGLKWNCMPPTLNICYLLAV